MKKLIVLGLLSIGSLFGQSGIASTSVYMTLASNLTSGYTTGDVSNIGQLGHQIIVQLANAPAHTCSFTSTSVTGSLQFSYDNSIWTPFGNPSSSDGNIPTAFGTALYFGAGSYPYVRFNLAAFDNTNCVATIYYTGSTQQANLNSTNTIIGGYVGQIGSSQTGQTTIPLTPTGTFNNGRSFPLVQCTSQFNSIGTVYAAGTYNLGMSTSQVTGAPQPGVGICNMTASASAAGSFKLFLSSTADCLSPLGSFIFGPVYLPVNGTYTLGSGTGLVYSFSASNSNARYVCATITGTVYLSGWWSTL